MRPLLVAEAVEIVAQVPGDVRESAQPRDRVPDVAPLVLAAGRRLGLVRGDVQNRRDDHVAVPGEAQHALPLLPVRDVEAREVDARVVEVLGLFPPPRGAGTT